MKPLITILFIIASLSSFSQSKKEKKQLYCTVIEIVDRGKGKVHCMAVTESGRTISIKRTGKRSGEIVPGIKLLLVSRYKTRYEDFKVCSITILK